MFSAKGIRKVALAAFAGVMGLAAAQSMAAPFVTISLLGRVTGSGNPFTNNVTVTSGQTVDYAVQYQLGTEGSVNPFASNTTITHWVASADAPDPNGDNPDPVDPTAGLGSIRFSLFETNGLNPKSSLNSSARAGTSNPAGQTYGAWNAGTGSGNGTRTARADGGFDDIGTAFIRVAGTFDGIAADGVTREQVIVNDPANTASRFTVTGTPGTSLLQVGTQGLATNALFLGFRWRDAGGAAVNTTISVQNQLDSAAAGNPIAVLQPLSVTIAPEPTSLALLGVAGLGLMRRRKA